MKDAAYDWGYLNIKMSVEFFLFQLARRQKHRKKRQREEEEKKRKNPNLHSHQYSHDGEQYGGSLKN